MKAPVASALIIVGLFLLAFGWWHGDQQFTVQGAFCSSAFQPVGTAGEPLCASEGQAGLMESGLAIGIGAMAVLSAIVVTQLPGIRTEMKSAPVSSARL